jgi:hypothetical protein
MPFQVIKAAVGGIDLLDLVSNINTPWINYTKRTERKHMLSLFSSTVIWRSVCELHKYEAIIVIPCRRD